MLIDDNDDEVDLTFQTDHSKVNIINYTNDIYLYCYSVTYTVQYSEVSTQTSQVEYGRRKWLKPREFCLSLFIVMVLISTLIFQDTEASEKICAVISNTRFCNDVSKMSPCYQTSSLEAFHSVVNQFAPKSRSFSYEGMLARLVCNIIALIL